MNELELNQYVAAADERDRADLASDHGPVSITFTSADGNQQWGEFLSWEEAARLYFWLGGVLRPEASER